MFDFTWNDKIIFCVVFPKLHINKNQKEAFIFFLLNVNAKNRKCKLNEVFRLLWFKHSYMYAYMQMFY